MEMDELHKLAAEMPAKVRKRSPNYTDKEVALLLKLIFSHIEIVESKKTDSETWRVKDIVWKNIAESYNSEPGTTKRPAEALRQKYDCIKKIARKKDAKNREEQKKMNPEFIEYDEHEKELLRILNALGNGNGVASSTPTSTSALYEPADLSQEASFTSTVKQEKNHEIQRNHNRIPEYEFNDCLDTTGEPERFIVTDDDMLWDLPDNTSYRPRSYLVKKQLEQLEKEEERLVKEHNYRLKNLQIKRKIMMDQERRSRQEHRKKMELLELELSLKKDISKC